MANINRMRVAWGGTGIVGPGLTTFYFTGTMPGKPAAVLNFFTAVSGFLPPGITWTIPGTGDTLEDSTGALTGGWTASGGGLVNSAGSGSWAAGAGALVDLFTANVHKGRRVRGRFFLVPFTGGNYDTSGTIANATVTSVNTALNTLLAAVTPDWRVYSRPDAIGAFAVSSVTSAVCPDRVTTLRSRRT